MSALCHVAYPFAAYYAPDLAPPDVLCANPNSALAVTVWAAFGIVAAVFAVAVIVWAARPVTR